MHIMYVGSYVIEALVSESHAAGGSPAACNFLLRVGGSRSRVTKDHIGMIDIEKLNQTKFDMQIAAEKMV